MATKSAPITSETGLSQLVTASPSALPGGTRPAAIAPTTVPMKNGVRSDESPKSARRSARPPARRACVERKARAAHHDAERREAERDEQGREDRLEAGEKPSRARPGRRSARRGWPPRPGRSLTRPARGPAGLVRPQRADPRSRPEVCASENGVDVAPNQSTAATTSAVLIPGASASKPGGRLGLRANGPRRRQERRPRASGATSPGGR